MTVNATTAHVAELRAAGHSIPRAFIHAGLRWEQAEDQDWYFFEPAGAFEVDGIVYDYDHRITGVHCARLMVEALEDLGGIASRMRCHQPMTEEELDRWVRTGHMLARMPLSF